MEYRKTDLCQLPGLSCFGCCGRKFGSKQEMEKALKENKAALKKHRNLSSFRDREDENSLHGCGICFNLIREGKSIFCPLHPMRNEGRDFREGHCDIHYLCRTAKKFNSWPDDKKQRYLDFIRKKNPDWYEYSIKTDNGEFLKEFEGREDEKEN